MVKTIDECFFQIQNGANIKQGDVDDGFPITRIETTANDKFNRDRMGYAGITDISKYESYVLEDGDLLMSHINSVQYLGRTVLYVKEADETIIHGMNLLRLKARRNIIDPSYARYCFYGHSFRSKISNITKKSVNQASFAVKDLKQIKIEVPSLSEQDQIVKILDGIQNLIQMRNDELSALDDLIKARFVEMFGDPKANPFEWTTSTLGELILSCEAGWSGNGMQRKKKDGEIAVLKVSAVTKGYFDFDECKVLDDQDIIKKYVYPQAGDLLFSRANTREMIGATAVITQDYPEHILSDKLWRVRFCDAANVWYMKYVLSSKSIRSIFSSVSNGTSGSMFNVSMGKFKSIRIPLPPIELQQQFADFVTQVDKSKAAVQKALDETQLLFDSLMQEYFG